MPNKEDWELYGQTSCSIKHWPDMWEGEIAAEASLYRERMNPTVYHCHPLSYSYMTRVRKHDALIIALVQLAEKNKWRKVFVSPETGKTVYRIK